MSIEIPERVLEAARKALWQEEGDAIVDSPHSFARPVEIALQAALKEWGAREDITMRGFRMDDSERVDWEERRVTMPPYRRDRTNGKDSK